MIQCPICGKESKVADNGRVIICSIGCKEEAHRRRCRKYYIGKGKITRKQYIQSESGKAALKRYYDKKNNSPERKEYMRVYTEEHRKHLNMLCRQRRKLPNVKAKDKAYQQAYFSSDTNWQARLEYQKLQRKKNGWDKKYLASPKGKAWSLNVNHRRRMRMKQPDDKVTWMDVAEIYRRCKYRCIFCQTTNNLTIDHIIPLGKQGRHVNSNLQILCRSCNIEKSDKL